MKRHSSPSRMASANAPKQGRVRLGAVKPAMTTSWRFDVLIFSQLSVRAPDRYWLSALGHDAFEAVTVSFSKEFRAEGRAVTAKSDQFVLRQNSLKPLLTLQQRKDA